MLPDSSYDLDPRARTDRALSSGARAPALRAGLRTAPPAHQPPPMFAAVEMAVLIVVTALAMVSIIVSADADASPRRSTSADASYGDRPAAHAQAGSHE